MVPAAPGRQIRDLPAPEDLPVSTFGRVPAHPVTPQFRRTRRPAPTTAALVLGGLAVLLVSGIIAAML